jgi:hypothetical protein
MSIKKGASCHYRPGDKWFRIGVVFMIITYSDYILCPRRFIRQFLFVKTSPKKATSRLSHPQRKRLLNIIESSKNTVSSETPHNISTALCHKTLFGSVDIWTVIDWAVYHHLLGLDHIFMSYTADLVHADGFDVLASLPYVTFVEVPGYAAKVDNRLVEQSDERTTTTKQQFSQRELMDRCLQHDAAAFDWVLLSDSDEYLWFHENVGLKDWLAKQDTSITYFSFGKSMYTMSHSLFDNDDPNNNSAFYLADFPFTAGLYCDLHEVRDEVCLGMNGRAKVLVQPSTHKSVPIHGFAGSSTALRPHHWMVPGREAHLKEWKHANCMQEAEPILVSQGLDFNVTRSSASIHRVDTYFRDGAYATMQYDPTNKEWFDYVASRAQQTKQM